MQASGRQRKPSQDGWVEERCIGSGSFGTVMLWEHKITKEQVTLKRCRLDLSPQNRQRWQTEVEIMKSLNHMNIVRAKDVPPALDVGEGELPLLAMEYCQGGDLRKVLNAPENCTGLKESTVLRVTADIACAVQFLHSKRIIHRDLKPENVVISHSTAGQATYKLIDLGYAKQLDQGSMTATFVGTLKYLAPELLAGNGSYTKTVDYWSLGTVVFECITGKRPFPDLSPVQWHMEVREKSAADVHAYFDASGTMKFSNVLPTPNSLSSCYQDKFVCLLRLLLLWDPKQRGGVLHKNGTRECFDILEDIIDTKVIHVFLMSTCTLLAYEVSPTDTIEDIHVKIQQDTGIPHDSQELLSPNGDAAQRPILASEYFNKMGNAGQPMFLFSSCDVPQSPRLIFTLSSTVQAVATEPNTLLSFEELQKVQGEALRFCRDQMQTYHLLLQGHRAAMKHVLKLNSKLSQLKNTVSCDVLRLQERAASYKDSLHTDLEQYSDVALDLKGGDGLLRSWKDAQRKADQLNKVDVVTLEKQSVSVQTLVMELQRNPYTQPQSKSIMDDIYEAAFKAYEEMKQMRANCTVYDQRVGDCSQMAPVVMHCLTTREKLIKDVYSHLSHVLVCTRKIQAMIPKLEETGEEVKKRREDLVLMQKKRQSDVWKLIKQTTQTTFPSGIAVTANCASFGSQFSEESCRLMEQSCLNMERFAEAFQSVNLDKGNSPEPLDWSFLSADEDENHR